MTESRKNVEFAEGTAPARSRGPWFVMAAAAFLFFWMLGGRPLYAPDEGRYALIGREMLDSGDWVVPTLTGIPYLDKPPLLYWLEASGLAVFGRNDFGVRFFPACVALVGVWLTWLLGKEMFDHERGVMAAAIVACSALYAGLARILLTDMPLSVAVLGAYVGFFRAWKGKSGAMAMWISLALAFLAKGPVGPALFVFGAAPFWWFARPRPPLRTFRPVLGPIVWIVLALPWTICLAIKVPDYLRFFYWRENIQALGSKNVHHPHPWYYAVYAVVSGFMPWTMLLPEAVWAGVKRMVAKRRGPGAELKFTLWAKGAAKEAAATLRNTEPGMHLALWWAGTTMAVFTISVSKLTTYYLPMFPALAVLVARGLGRDGQRRRISAWVLGALAVAIPAVVLLAPRFVDLFLKSDTLTSARLALSGGMPVALALVLGGAAGVSAWLFSRGRSFQACQAMLAGFALAMVPGAPLIHRFDNVRCTREILLKNAALIRSADAVISDRSPIGLPEWYLGVPVWYMGSPHDFFSGRDLAPEKGRFLEVKKIPEFLKTHPRTVLLTVLRKREDMQGDYPTFHEVDLDEGNILLASPEVK